MGPPSDSNILATLAATAKINQSLTYGNSYAIGDIYANDPREGEMNFNWSFNGAYQHHSYQLLNISHLNDPVVNGSAGHIGGSGRLRFSWGDDRYTGHDGTIDQWWVHARRVRYFAAPSQGTSFEIPSGNFFVGPGAGSTGPIINPVGWLRVGVFDTQGLNSTTHLVGQHGLGSGGGPPSAGVNVGGIILSAISVTNGFPTQGTAPRCLTSVFGHTVHVSGPGATLIGPGDISTYWRGTPTDGPSGWFATGASSGVISGSTCITGTSVCINSHNIVMAGGIAVARSGGQITNQNGGNAVGLAATLTVEHPDIPGHFFDLFRNGFFMGGPIPLKLSGSTESGYVGGNNNIEGALGTANGGLGQSNPGTAGAFLVGTGASATYTESSTVREAVSAGIIETLVDTGIWSRTTSITI
jgi:hypothetical protein